MNNGVNFHWMRNNFDNKLKEQRFFLDLFFTVVRERYSFRASDL